MVGIKRVEVPDSVYLETFNDLPAAAIGNYFNHRQFLTDGGQNTLTETKTRQGIRGIIQLCSKQGKYCIYHQYISSLL